MNATQPTDAHKRVVEEIVRDFFDALDTSDSVEEGGMGSQREAVEYDLGKLSPEELCDALKQTERFLYHLWDVAGEMNYVATAVVSDAHNRAKAALERVEEARRSQA